jgi:hypothetical protein
MSPGPQVCSHSQVCLHTVREALPYTHTFSLSHTHKAPKDSDDTPSEEYACGVITTSPTRSHAAVGRKGARGAGRGRDGERWQTVKMTWTSPLPSPRVERTQIMSTDAMSGPATYKGQTNGWSPDGSKTSQSSLSCHSALHSPTLRSLISFFNVRRVATALCTLPLGLLYG